MFRWPNLYLNQPTNLSTQAHARIDLALYLWDGGDTMPGEAQEHGATRERFKQRLCVMSVGNTTTRPIFELLFKLETKCRWRLFH